MDVDGEPAAAASGSAGGGGEVERAVHAPELEPSGSGAAKKKKVRTRLNNLSKFAQDKAKRAADRAD